jgi:hypothetical protein
MVFILVEATGSRPHCLEGDSEGKDWTRLTSVGQRAWLCRNLCLKHA